MRRIPYHRLPQIAPALKEPETKTSAQTDDGKILKFEAAAPPAPKKTIHIENLLQPISNYLPFILLFFILQNRESRTVKTQNASSKSSSLKESIQNIIENPQTVDILNAVCPYLSEQEQAPIHTIVGFIHTLDMIRALQNGNYRIQGVSPNPSLSKRDRQLGIIRAVKDFTQDEDRKSLEQLEKGITFVNEIENFMTNFKEFRTNQTGKPGADQIIDIIKIFKPLLPEDRHPFIDKLATMVKMMEVMDTSGFTTQEKKNTNTSSEDKKELEIIPDNQPSKNRNESDDHKTAGNGDAVSVQQQQERLMNAIKPLLNEEQQKSMGKIMQLAQSLSSQMNESKG